MSKKEMLSLASDPTQSVSDLIEITLYSRQEIAFRAAWLMESIFDHYQVQFLSTIPQFISAYAEQKNQSCLRHYTKILMSLTSKKIGVLLPLQDEIVEVTFELMIRPETPVAVKVNCMDILYNLRGDYDWLAEELEAQIRFYLKTGSAAMQSRGNRILNKLKLKLK
jgi:hypothetical protein